VTARLATHADVAARAAEVHDRLVAAGVDIDPIDSSEGECPLTRIRERSADLALVGMRALRGIASDGLTLLAVLPREDPRDVVLGVAHQAVPLRALPAGSRVGVRGARRRAFLLAHRPDVEVRELPDDSHLDAYELHAAIVASGHARRSGLANRVGEVLDSRSWLPEPGQGTLALVARHPIAEVTGLDHLPTRTALRAELALIDALEAPEDAPLGCVAQPSGRLVRLWAAVLSADGTRLVRSDLTAPLDEPELLGAAVARQLRSRGATLVHAGIAG